MAKKMEDSFCSAKDVDGKIHRLFFPEGSGFLNEWALLAKK